MELPKDFDAPPIVTLRKPAYSRRVAPKGPGRALGSKNRIPATIKAAVVEGLAAHGSDGKGRGGLPGFVYFLAARYPKQACKLIERLLPAAAVISPESGSAMTIGAVNVVSIPHGEFLSKADATRFSTPLSQRSIDISPTGFERNDDVEPEPVITQDKQLAQLSSEEEEQIIRNLKAEINELTRQAGLPSVV